MRNQPNLFLALLLLWCITLSSQPVLYHEAPLFDNSTSTGRGPNGTSSHVYMRAVSLVKAAELTGIAPNSTISVFGFTLNSGASGNAASGNFTLYLQNTTDITYNKGTSFAAAIPGMSQVYAGIMTIPLAAGSTSVTVTLSSPFVYTGGGIYVAYDWYNPGPYSSAAAVYRCNSGGLSPGCASIASPTGPAPDGLGTTAFRPCFVFGVTNTYTNEISVTGVQAPGKITGILNTSHNVIALVKNNGNQSRNNIAVTLNATGANPVTTTQTITSLAAGAVTTVAFPYAPSLSGLSTLSVSVPADELNTNNSATYQQSVSCNEWALGPAGVSYTSDAVGFGAGAGVIALTYSATSAVSLSGINYAVSTNTASLGNQLWGVLANSSGVIVATTNTLTLTSGMLGSFITFTFSAPPALNAGTTYYFGLAQPANATAYYPLGSYTAATTPFSNFVTLPLTGGTPAALTGNLGYLGLEAVFSPSLNIAVNAPTITCGSQAVLSATASVGTFSWSGGPATANYSVSPVSNTTYTVKVNFGSCSFSSTALVAVNPIVISASASSPSVCAGRTVAITGSGATSYTWNTTPVINTASFTATPALTTTYNVQAANPNGCSNSASVIVTVNPNPTVTAGSQTVVCGTQATLSASSSASSYTWTSGPVNANYLVTPTVNTTYSVSSVTGAGCVSSATVLVTVAPLTVTAAGTSSICAGDTISLQAGGASIYTWNTQPPVSAASFTDIPLVTTTYSVTGSNTAGCSNTAAITVTVAAAPALVASSSPTAVCLGNSATLSVTGAASYTWGTAGPVISNSVAVNPTVTTTYTVEGTDALGCLGSTTIALTVNSFTSLLTSASGYTTCLGHAITAAASGASTYTWNTGALTFTAAAITQTPAANGIYTVNATDGNGCQDSKTVAITVNPNPTVTAVAAHTVLCVGKSTTLTAGGASSYTWTGGASSPALVVTPPFPGILDYTLTGTDINGCTASATVSIVVDSAPTITASATGTFLCVGESTTLTAGGAAILVWTGGISGNSPVISPTISGISGYTVTGTNASGCSAESTVTVEVSDCTGIRTELWSNTVFVYPNPSAGQVNLQFGSTPENISVRILNTLGQIVAEHNNASVTSRLSFEEQPAGVYSILILSNGKPVYTGKLIKQ